jgi:SWI/SNF-related matrix-associated actin-dependent regulator of chromatin subfamily A3
VCTYIHLPQIGIDLLLRRTLRIYGASDKRDQLEPLLIWATPRQRGFSAGNNSNTIGGRSSVLSSAATSSSASNMASRAKPGKGQTKAQLEAAKKQQEAFQKAAELKQMLNNLERVDDEGRRSSLLDTLCSTDDILTLPLHPSPPGISSGELVVDLLKHQVCF